MKKFSFNISFMKSAKCCDFGGELLAMNFDDAKKQAKSWAKMNGFNGVIRTIEIQLKETK